MALDKAGLKSAIKTMIEGGSESNPDAVADELATAIDAFVRTGTVTVAAGIPVTTAVSSGSTSGPGTGTIS